MWISLFMVLIAGAVFLYVPGFLLLRTFRLTSIVSLVFAPFISVLLYEILVIAYAALGIGCSAVTVFGPAVGLGLVCCVVSELVAHKRPSVATLAPLNRLPKGFKHQESANWLLLLCYVVFALLLVGFYFLINLDSLDSYVQEYDNLFHMSVLNNFVQSGTWSPLGIVAYYTDSYSVLPMAAAGAGVYYPAAWHLLCAMIATTLSLPITLVMNGVLALLAGVVYPASVFMVLRKLLADKPYGLIAGIFAAVAFQGIPWGFLVFGPLSPNLMSFAVSLPPIVFFFISMVDGGIKRKRRALFACLTFLAILSGAFTQPNTVFTAATFLIPFCTYKVFITCKASSNPRFNSAKGARWAAIGFVAFAFVVWMICFKMPFLQGVVHHEWAAFCGPQKALVYALNLSLCHDAMQLVLAVTVFLGIVYTFKHREYLWITIAYLFMLLAFMVSASTGCFLKFLMAGFWYTDFYRLSANLAFYGIPLACLGLCIIKDLFLKLIAALEKLVGDGQAKQRLGLATILSLLLFVLCNFYPNYTLSGVTDVTTAFGSVRDYFRNATGVLNDEGEAEELIFDKDEMAFVDQVIELIGSEALVINEPNDGTAYAHAAGKKINLYYQMLRDYNDETPESLLIRNSLYQIASNAEVRNAVNKLAVRYVLVLDQGDVDEERPYPFTYESEEWVGINSITDDTPGFEILLSDGDMRLYRIEAY